MGRHVTALCATPTTSIQGVSKHLVKRMSFESTSSYVPSQQHGSGVVSRAPHAGNNKWAGTSVVPHSHGEVNGRSGDSLHSDAHTTHERAPPESYQCVVPRGPHVTTQSGYKSTSSSSASTCSRVVSHYIPGSGHQDYSYYPNSQSETGRTLPESVSIARYDVQPQYWLEGKGQRQLARRYSTGSSCDSRHSSMADTQYPTQPWPQFSQRLHVEPHVYTPFPYPQPASLPENINLYHKVADRSVCCDDSKHEVGEQQFKPCERKDAHVAKVLPTDGMEIIIHPQSCNVFINHCLRLECDVRIHGSNEPPNYLWYRNGSALVGEVDKEYVVSAVAQSEAGEYFCLVSDPFDKVRQQSNTAIVTVTEIPSVPEIIQQPSSSIVVAIGETVEVCIKAIGKPPLQYTWYKSTKELLYASTAVVHIPNANRLDNGSYCCTVWNEHGSVLSSSCEVRVVHKAPTKVPSEQLGKNNLSDQEQKVSAASYDIPRVVVQPEDVNVVYGQPFTLEINIDNADIFTRYKWYKNKLPLSGRDAPQVAVHSAVNDDAGQYYCVISNSVGSTCSVSVQVKVVNIQEKMVANIDGSDTPQSIQKVSEKPVITKHPLSQAVDPGLPLLLTCDATICTGKLEYLWYFNGLSLISENQPQYFIHCFTDEDEGLYSCEVSGNHGSSMSNIAQVTIRPDST